MSEKELQRELAAMERTALHWQTVAHEALSLVREVLDGPDCLWIEWNEKARALLERTSVRVTDAHKDGYG